MHVLDWINDEQPPDTWTPDRVRKVALLEHCGGDLDAARDAWKTRSRLAFAAFLVDHGRLGQGDTSADEREVR